MQGKGLERLVQRLSRLQKDYVVLDGRHEQLTTELRQAQSDKENLHDELTRTKDLPLLLKVGHSVQLSSEKLPYKSSVYLYVGPIHYYVQLVQPSITYSYCSKLPYNIQYM